MKESKDNIQNICSCCSKNLHKEFQKTFDKDDVKIGMHIKKAFEDDKNVEHLWVKVKEICADGFKGYVDNNVISVKNVKLGDYVKVKFEEVEAILQ